MIYHIMPHVFVIKKDKATHKYKYKYKLLGGKLKITTNTEWIKWFNTCFFKQRLSLNFVNEKINVEKIIQICSVN